MMIARKAHITSAFSAAAANYDEHAQVQSKVARQLAKEILFRLPHHGLALDIGCGTGEMATQLAPHWDGSWLMTDIAHSMVRQAQHLHQRHNADFLVMDGEQPAVQGEFQLIVSNLAAQWFSNLPQALTGLYSLLAPGGHLALTTLGADNFFQWNKACARVGVGAGTHHYPTLRQLLEMLPKATHAKQYMLATPFTHPLSFLQTLKNVGAHVPRPGYRGLGVTNLRQVLKELAREKVMTYHILEIIISRH